MIMKEKESKLNILYFYIIWKYRRNLVKVIDNNKKKRKEKRNENILVCK